MSDKLELMKTEAEVVGLLAFALLHGPESDEAKSRITALGHLLVNETDHDQIGYTMDRIVRLDPSRARERHDILEMAWETVGREGDEHWA